MGATSTYTGVGKGNNPNSKANLLTEPRYGEKKKSLTLTVTPTGKIEATKIAHELGCRSLSDLIEQIGRGKMRVEPVEDSVA